MERGNNKMTEQRTDLNLRKLFDETYEELCELLSCFEPQFHKEVFRNYVKTYKFQQDNPQFLGRLMNKLKLEE
jgi:hypothetical protein